jgi:predicted metal-dependent phosphoesterase TrpH
MEHVLAGRADLHVHSTWSDGGQSPQALVRAAQAASLDVLAITDHDEIRGALLARAFARAHPELGVEVVIGEEISTLNGHLLGFFLEERVPPGLTAERSIELIHAQRGLAVAAHPFHPICHRAAHHPALAAQIPHLALDALEVINNSGPSAVLYDAWAALRNTDWLLPVTGGSDAHDAWYVGSAVTRFPGRSAEALRSALIAGATRARRQWTWRVDSLPRHLWIRWRSYLRFITTGRPDRPVSWIERVAPFRRGGQRERTRAPAVPLARAR